MYAEYADSNPTNNVNKTIKLSTARIENRKYESIHQENINT
jgi:hypothetical protein